MSNHTHPEVSTFDHAFARGDVATARAAAERLRAEAPDAVETHVLAARLEAADGEAGAALKKLARLVKKNPKSGMARAYYGSLLVLTGSAGKAIGQLKMALAADGGVVPSTYHALGLAMFEAKRYADACEHLYDALAALPSSASSAFWLGQSHEALGQVPAAARAYARCVDIEPAHADAWIGLARLRAHAGDIAGAAEVADRALADNPDDVDLLRLRVQAAFDLGDDAAVRDHLARIPDDARSVEDWCNLAVFSLRVVHWDEAERCARAGVALDGEAWWPRHLLALALEGRKAARADIVAAWEAALETGDPSGHSGTAYGFFLLTGDDEERAPESAVAVLEEAAEKNGGAAGTMLNLALAWENVGEAARAQNIAAVVADHPRAGERERAQANRILEALSA